MKIKLILLFFIVINILFSLLLFFTFKVNSKVMIGIIISQCCALWLWFFITLFSIINENKFPNISDIILNGLIKDYYFYGKYLVSCNKDIPMEIEKEISKDYRKAYEYAVSLLEYGRIASLIIQDGISKSAQYSFKYAQVLIGKNVKVPWLIEQGISKNPFYASLYIEELLNKR